MCERGEEMWLNCGRIMRVELGLSMEARWKMVCVKEMKKCDLAC